MSGSKVINFFPYSTLLTIKFVQLINIKMPNIVGILGISSRVNISCYVMLAESFGMSFFYIYKQDKYHVWTKFITFRLYTLSIHDIYLHYYLIIL